ncbi:MAG: protein BatD [Gammaproteobacteria bacterium]|nr:protein BatD [Gammaproteobacteria bacterium]
MRGMTMHRIGGATSAWIVALWLLLSLPALAATLDARLDRNRISEGETVMLMLSTSGDSDGAPDLAPLLQDFDVLNRSQSSSFSMINGRTRSSREWQVVLAPKRAGTLTVPALHMGAVSSRPLTLEVLPPGQADPNGPPQPVRIETEATPERPYVQGKVVYTVRVLTRVPLRQPQLTEPVAAGAIVERLGDERQYESQRDGQTYHVIERRYALFPQRSGTLEIEAPVLSAQVAEPGKSRNSLRDRMFGGDPFAGMGSMFEQLRPLRLRGRSLTLEVQPQPAGSPSPWLPAESLTLNETWAPNPPTFRVGEPVTRTVVITAQGVTASQLPDLSGRLAADGISAYPDQPLSETRADGDTLVAQKVLRSALVPSVAGELELPAIEVTWWDSDSGQARTARLPARTIEVAPAPPGAASPPPASPARGMPSRTADEPVTERPAVSVQAAADGTAAGPVVGIAGLWPYLAVLFGLAWLVTLLLWWRARSRRPAGTEPQPAARTAPRTVAGASLAGFERACRANDPRAARSALLAWAAARWPHDPPQRLEQLAQRLGTDAVPLVHEMDRHLYADGAGGWDGAQAWQGFEPLLERAQRDQRVRHDRDALPPLYPRDA